MFVVEIEKTKCEGCGDCVDICPSDCFEIVDENGKKIAIFSALPDDCIGCMACEGACPEGSITVIEE
jgi:NAD-dependent dihydropyrimidine dehydrogenase PreA subunit